MEFLIECAIRDEEQVRRHQRSLGRRGDDQRSTIEFGETTHSGLAATSRRYHFSKTKKKKIARNQRIQLALPQLCLLGVPRLTSSLVATCWHLQRSKGASLGANRLRIHHILGRRPRQPRILHQQGLVFLGTLSFYFKKICLRETWGINLDYQVQFCITICKGHTYGVYPYKSFNIFSCNDILRSNSFPGFFDNWFQKARTTAGRTEG